MTLHEYCDKIDSREGFIVFLRAMQADLREKGDTWENGTLERFLSAACAWVEDMDGYYTNKGKAIPEQPDWRVLGEILLAARVYE